MQALLRLVVGIGGEELLTFKPLVVNVRVIISSSSLFFVLFSRITIDMSREIYNLFNSLTPETVPRQSPGTKYLHQWENNNAKDDWCADGYRWRQNGPENSENVKKASCRAYKLMCYVSNVPDMSSIRAAFP